MSTSKKAIFILVVLLVSFNLGYQARAIKLFPLNQWFWRQSHPVLPDLGIYDDFGRLTAYPNKKEVACPHQTQDTALLLAIGQSNSANHAEKKYATQNPQRVFNYFGGKCYVASSPLLGASGEDGEFLTPVADNLISNGTYKSVIIISSGIGGTSISRWQEDGDLNEMLLTTIKDMKHDYKITDIIWHQGEKDFIDHTSSKNYIKSFNSLLDSLAKNNVVAPIFISVSTKCGLNDHWNENNPTANGQRQLIDNKKIYLGANTDTLLADTDRRIGTCHFSESGQLKTASSYAEAIMKEHQTN